MKIAIALCGACGAPRPEGLAHLAERNGRVDLWWVADLCKDADALRKIFDSHVEYVIVLGASAPEGREFLLEAAQAAGLHPLNLDFVDVPVPPTPAACEAVLRAAKAAVRDFREADERHVKPSNRVRGGVTRRSFLRGMHPSAVVSIPRIAEDRCRSRSGCSLCVSACPSRALELHGGVVRLRAAACTGCNRCVAACPTGAMENPFADYARLRHRVAEWVRATTGHPRRFVLACAPSAIAALEAVRRSKAAGTLFQEIPCLGALRAREYLDLLATGIEQVVCVRDARACEPGQQCWDPMPRALGGLTPIESVHHRVIEADPDELPAILSRPVPRMTMSRMGPPFGSLHEAVAWALDSKDGLVTVCGRGAGFVEIQADRCTGCFVCRDRCPTDAIQVPPESDEIRIEFEHARCDACGLCETACPEGALTVHPEIRLDRVGSRGTLFSDEWSRCRQCGNRVAPRRMLVELARRIERPIESFDVCPTCRLRGTGQEVSKPAAVRTSIG